MDAGIAFGVFAFVWAYFKKLPWWPRAGAFCLVAMNLSALTYSYLVLTRKAWPEDPVGYAIVVIAYFPVVILTLLWLTSGDEASCRL